MSRNYHYDQILSLLSDYYHYDNIISIFKNNQFKLIMFIVQQNLLFTQICKLVDEYNLSFPEIKLQFIDNIIFIDSPQYYRLNNVKFLKRYFKLSNITDDKYSNLFNILFFSLHHYTNYVNDCANFSDEKKHDIVLNLISMYCGNDEQFKLMNYYPHYHYVGSYYFPNILFNLSSFREPICFIIDVNKHSKIFLVNYLNVSEFLDSHIVIHEPCVLYLLILKHSPLSFMFEYHMQNCKHTIIVDLDLLLSSKFWCLGYKS